MIKLLYNGLSSHLGGIETYLYKIAKNIDRTKYKITFLVQKGENPIFYNELMDLGCDFIFVTSRRENALKHRKELKEAITSGQFDILHAHLVSLSNINSVLIALQNDIPTVIHSHSSNTTSSILSKVLHQLNKMKLTKYNYTSLAVSQVAAEWMFGVKETIILNNGIDIHQYKFNKDDREQYRENLNLTDSFVITHIGRMVEVKNHTFIIDVFNEIFNRNNKAKLLLVGPEGPLKKDILNKINELNLNNQVLYLGPRNDVPQLFSAADAFLFPSLYEGFPGAVIEAQTSGLPCLISENITEEVVVLPNCEQYKLDSSPTEWAEKLLELPTLNIREDAINYIRKHGLAVEDEISKIENIYQKIL